MKITSNAVVMSIGFRCTVSDRSIAWQRPLSLFHVSFQSGTGEALTGHRGGCFPEKCRRRNSRLSKTLCRLQANPNSWFSLSRELMVRFLLKFSSISLESPRNPKGRGQTPGGPHGEGRNPPGLGRSEAAHQL